jgi:septation ring formation regulator EzrA
LDFLNEKLLWREQKKEKIGAGEDASYSMDEVRAIKHECLIVNPEVKLWRGATKNLEEVRNIFNHLMSLRYEDKPSYSLIRDNLKSILNKNQTIPRTLNSAPHMIMMPNSCGN